MKTPTRKKIAEGKKPMPLEGAVYRDGALFQNGKPVDRKAMLKRLRGDTHE